MNKTDFDKKLTSLNRRITSNKTKHLEAQKILNSLITKDCHFFLGRIYFTSNDTSQNTFVYQPAFDALELKKEDKGTDYVLSWKSKGVYNSKLRNPTNNFKFKNCLFGATNIRENSDKEKHVCSGYGITIGTVQVHEVVVMMLLGML